MITYEGPTGIRWKLVPAISEVTQIRFCNSYMPLLGVNTYIHAYIHTYIHTYTHIHTYMHTYTYIHTHTHT